MAVMVEIEPINSKPHLFRQLKVYLLLWFVLRDPLLQLGLTCDAITIDLIPASNEDVKWLFGMPRKEIAPDWVISTLEARPTERIGINTGAESIALCETAVSAKATYLSKCSQSRLPVAYSGSVPGRKT